MNDRSRESRAKRDRRSAFSARIRWSSTKAPAMALTVLALTATALTTTALTTTATWACPGMGRSDRQVVVEGRESDEVLDCTRASIAAAGPGISLGRTAGDVCVKWIEEGFVYNPRTPKDGTKITDEREMIRHRVTYKCEDNQYLFGLLGNIDCVPQNTQEVEAQLHVLAEERCRAVAEAGTPGIVPALEGAESP